MSPPWCQLHGARDDVMAVFRSLKKQYHAPHLPWRKLFDTTSSSRVAVDAILITLAFRPLVTLVRVGERNEARDAMRDPRNLGTVR